MKGDDFQKRKTKKDKAKRNFELYGKFTPKHIRQQEELQHAHIQRIDKAPNAPNAPNTHTGNTSENKNKKKNRK